MTTTDPVAAPAASFWPRRRSFAPSRRGQARPITIGQISARRPHRRYRRAFRPACPAGHRSAGSSSTTKPGASGNIGAALVARCRPTAAPSRIRCRYVGAEPRVFVAGLRSRQGLHHRVGTPLGFHSCGCAQIRAGDQPQGVRLVCLRQQGEFRFVGNRLGGPHLRAGAERRSGSRSRS